jgi:hypothetical protein
VEKLLVFLSRNVETLRLFRKCLGIVANLSSRATAKAMGEKNLSRFAGADGCCK